MSPNDTVRVTIGGGVYLAAAWAVLSECVELQGAITLRALERYGVTEPEARAALVQLFAEMAAGKWSHVARIAVPARVA